MAEMLAAPNHAPAPFRPQESNNSRLAPVDEYGMPYAIHPYEAPPNKPDYWDEHHAFFQRNDPNLLDTAGQALRFSRVQEVPRWLHNHIHKTYFNGIESYPVTEEDKFALLVLSCAGYLPREAIDIRKRSEPKLVPMSRDTYEFVRGKRQLHFESRRDRELHFRTQSAARTQIAEFFRDYASRQNLDHIKDSTIDKFLHLRNPEKLRKLGCQLLAEAIDVAVTPVSGRYVEALEGGLVRPQLKSARAVIQTYFSPSTWPNYVEDFRETVAGTYLQAA